MSTTTAASLVFEDRFSLKKYNHKLWCFRHNDCIKVQLIQNETAYPFYTLYLDKSLTDSHLRFLICDITLAFGTVVNRIDLGDEVLLYLKLSQNFINLCNTVYDEGV